MDAQYDMRQQRPVDEGFGKKGRERDMHLKRTAERHAAERHAADKFFCVELKQKRIYWNAQCT